MEFQWMNPSEIVRTENRIEITATPQSDFFCNSGSVSVVTKNGASDDANGCNLEGNTAWLKVCRVDNTFSFHYSTDGERFYMVRFFSLPDQKVMKVGLLAQAPVGDGGIRVFEGLSIEKRRSRIFVSVYDHK